MYKSLMQTVIFLSQTLAKNATFRWTDNPVCTILADKRLTTYLFLKYEVTVIFVLRLLYLITMHRVTFCIIMCSLSM